MSIQRIFSEERRIRSRSFADRPWDRQSNEKRMSDGRWQVIMRLNNIEPDVLAHGLPPISTPFSTPDSYESKWKKNIFLEFHDLLSSFRRYPSIMDCRRSPLTFVRAGEVDEGGESNVEFRIANQELAESCEIQGAGDLMYAILKLSDGWMYVTRTGVESEPDLFDGSITISAQVILYSEGFHPISSEDRACRQGVRLPCTPFESFLGFRYRFVALSAFDGIDRDVRNVIVSGNIHATRTCSPSAHDVLRPMPDGCETLLNDKQRTVLNGICGPVDFVQGPPGTGKSTFIVEFLRHRVPKGERVLLCTTTNKAIDSFAEKIVACGHRNDVLAFGNPARLGKTSAGVTLKGRMESYTCIKESKSVRDAASSVLEKKDETWKLMHPELCSEPLSDKLALAMINPAVQNFYAKAKAFLVSHEGANYIADSLNALR